MYREFYNLIYKNFNSLSWCKWSFEVFGFNNNLTLLRKVINKNAVDYSTYMMLNGRFISKWEHTFMLKPIGKEIFTFVDDY